MRVLPQLDRWIPGLNVLLVDVGNVLIPYDVNDLLDGLSRVSGLSRTRVEGRVGRSNVIERFETGSLGTREFHARLTDVLGVELTFATFEATWLAPLGARNEPLWERLTRLPERIDLALASDTNPLHYRRIQSTLSDMSRFRWEFVSFRVGHRKLSDAYWNHVTGVLSVDPDRCLHIDDRPEICDKAREHGLRALCYSIA